MSRRIITFFLLFLGSLVLSAQSIPVNPRFGKVSAEECALSVYPADTSAAALVLWEEHAVVIDYDPSIGNPGQWITHTERIKILKDEGTSHADYSMLVSTRQEDHEGMPNLSVVTYNLEKGKVVETKMPKSNLFRTKYNDHYDKITFTAQAVKPGSVIEVRVKTTTARFSEIDDFYFQRAIPVNLCTYSISMPRWIGFKKLSRGFTPLEMATREVAGERMGDLVPNNVLDVEEYRAVDIPALDREPGVYCARQYRTAISYTVTGLNLPMLYRSFSATWEEVDELVRKSDIMKKSTAACRFKDEVDRIMAGDGSTEDKLAAIIKLVRDKVAWDRTIRLIPGDGADPLKSRSGSSADINALAASAIRYAGFQVAPVLISRRSNGTLMDFHPSTSAFDKFLLRIVTDEGTELFIDASNPAAWFNVLDDDDLVSRARVVPENGQGFWADLTAIGQNIRSYTVQADLLPNGTLKGTCEATFRGCSSLEFKEEFLSFDREETAVESLEKKLSLDISDFSVSQVRDFGNQSSMQFRFEKACSSNGETIYVEPFLIKFHSEAMFRAETRLIPIDFPYPERIVYNIWIRLPEGYVTEQIPERKRLTSNLPSSATATATQADGAVQLSYVFDLKTLLGQAQDYREIREYWNALCALYGQMIVVKKQN